MSRRTNINVPKPSTKYPIQLLDNQITELCQWGGSRKAPQGKVMWVKFILAPYNHLTIQSGVTSKSHVKLAAPIGLCSSGTGGGAKTMFARSLATKRAEVFFLLICEQEQQSWLAAFSKKGTRSEQFESERDRSPNGGPVTGGVDLINSI